MMALLTLLSPWLSPAAAWFIFFNAVVGAIAVMSSTTSGGAGAGTTSSQRRLCRSGSSSMGLDRLRSFFIFPVGQLPIDESSAASGSHFCSQEAEAAAAAATQACAPAEPNPQAVVNASHATIGESETAAISAAQPSALPAMATAEDHVPPAPSPEEDKKEAEAEAEKEQDHDESISLDEAYALARRHRAQPLASPPPAAAAAIAALPTTEHKKKPAKELAADCRSVAKAGELALEGKAELNARAELFIRQFREDLRLQRLNSILKHTHALGSPTAAAR